MVFAEFILFKSLELHMKFTIPCVSNSFYGALVMLSVTLPSVKYFCKGGQGDSVL